MTITILKPAHGTEEATASDITDTVKIMLANMAANGETSALDYARRLDGWTSDVIVPRARIDAAIARVPDTLKAHIQYAHANIRAFAEAQRASITEFETELRPGLIAGQKLLPLSAAGCYVPGGRYAHIASALMTITTARAAGVPHITACTPPRPDGIPGEILYAMDLAGADTVLAIGGVQGVAAMAQGMFDTPAADILVGPGNAYVAEAKRQLFGPQGIDMIAGPTDIMILADETADAHTVAWDLIGQAEHGPTSPCWLATTSRALAEQVLTAIPTCIAQLPDPNRSAAAAAWAAMGEVLLCDTAEEMATLADTYAAEHLHVQATDLDWWADRLNAYGSLFLGANTCVPFGDKASGPNHVLPTSRAARYTGGLSVHKFLKCVTYQRAEAEALPRLTRATAAISRAEGMEGHARSAECRLKLAAE